MLVYIVI